MLMQMALFYQDNTTLGKIFFHQGDEAQFWHNPCRTTLDGTERTAFGPFVLEHIL